MKKSALLLVVACMTGVSFAGSKTVVPPSLPPAPSLGGWFVGGTYGQVDIDHNGPGAKFDADLYSLHIGRDLGTQFLGFDNAAYLEVGLIEGDSVFNIGQTAVVLAPIDLEIIPVTINWKLERPIAGALSVYATAGIGYAFAEAKGVGSSIDGDGFYGQASLGLLYNISPSFEVFAGGRYLYLDSLDLGGVELEDSVAWEVGLRYNF